MPGTATVFHDSPKKPIHLPSTCQACQPHPIPLPRSPTAPWPHWPPVLKHTQCAQDHSLRLESSSPSSCLNWSQHTCHHLQKALPDHPSPSFISSLSCCPSSTFLCELLFLSPPVYGSSPLFHKDKDCLVNYCIPALRTLARHTIGPS